MKKDWASDLASRTTFENFELDLFYYTLLLFTGSICCLLSSRASHSLANHITSSDLAHITLTGTSANGIGSSLCALAMSTTTTGIAIAPASATTTTTIATTVTVAHSCFLNL
jgi:hypothetical protein